MEQKITIPCGRHQLEGYWQAGALDEGVVITHPHPLYGGTMTNPVVETIQKSFQQVGYATLRFNFRGVGGSQGNHDNGVGEQDDVRAAIEDVASRNVGQIDLVGYSFGAWVNSNVVAGGCTPIRSMVMISPPVGFIEFETVSALSCLRLVVTGRRDEIAPPDQIRSLLPAWNPDAQLEIIDGCDHFYSSHLGSLQSVLTRFLQSAKSEPA